MAKKKQRVGPGGIFKKPSTTTLGTGMAQRAAKSLRQVGTKIDRAEAASLKRRKKN